MSTKPDVAILGAGMAGLAAARVLAERGLDVEIVEAQERVGGRAITAHPHGDLPAELGPEFVHGEPPATLALLREAGLQREWVADVHHARHGDLLVEERGVWDRLGDVMSHAPPASRDMSARDYLARQRISDHDRQLFENLIQGFYGAPINEISIASISEDSGGPSSVDEVPMTRVVGGYGALSHWLLRSVLSAGGHVRYGHVVRGINWGMQRARIDYQFGDTVSSLIARRVIITLPLGVLAHTGEDAIEFHPGLGAHARAMDGLAMGHVVKVVACMEAPVWREYTEAQLSFLHGMPGASFQAFWLRTRGRAYQLTAWAGGPAVRSFDGMSREQVVEQAFGDFAATLGMPAWRLEDAMRHFHFHDFQRDPFARGAYSYTRVGGNQAAAQLATPLGDVLYFAGEATDYEYEGSVAGALRSGERAAQQVLDHIGLRRAA